MATGGALGHSSHKAVRLNILADGRKTATKTSALDMRRAEFRLLRQLLSRISWEAAFEGVGVCQCWSVLKYHLLKVQEQAIPKCQEM